MDFSNKTIVLVFMLFVLIESAPDLGKIYRGRNESGTQFSFVVSIENDGYHECGGSVINDRWVLSAASCFTEQFNTSHWKVKTKSNIKNRNGTSYDVERIYIHENYRSGHYLPEKNIALLKVSKPFESNIVRNHVRLPKLGAAVAHNTSVYALGYGLTNSRGDYSEILQRVQLNIIDNDICNNSTKIQDIINAGDNPITSDMICAGKSGKDSCEGDIGGPLVVKTQHYFTLVGIIATGDCKGNLESPGVYTKVSSYIFWINFQMMPEEDTA